MPVDDQRPTHLREIDAAIVQVLQAAGALEERLTSELGRIPEEWRPSARNLLHYLALRAEDRRSLQERLSRLGLSSLGRSEAHVGASLEAIRAMIADAGCSVRTSIAISGPDFPLGSDLLRRHTEELLGPRPETRDRYLMVTLSEEAASDYATVRALVEAGMDCARINAGKNTPSEWTAMAEHVRRASEEVGRPCRVLVDLAGPKVRTGPLEAGPAVLDLDPKRDAYGRPRDPLRIRLVPNGTGTLAPENNADAAMGERAECIMLNKGKHVVDALHTLDDIIHRMSAHQYKKRARLRKLSVAAPFGPSS